MKPSESIGFRRTQVPSLNEGSDDVVQFPEDQSILPRVKLENCSRDEHGGERNPVDWV